MTLHIRRWLTAAVASAALLGTAGPAALADTPAPVPAPAGNAGAAFTVEDGSYPGAKDLLQATGITVTRGDGGIVYTPCDSPHQIVVWARSVTLPVNRACFAAPGASGYLAVTVPDAFRIEASGRTLHANLTTNGSSQSVDVAADTSVTVGEAASSGSHSVLLELNVTGSTAQPPAAPAPDPVTAATARIAVGDLGHGGRSCTGTLVAPQWVLSAAACFATDPADATTAPTGLLSTRTTAAIGGHTVEVTELAPRTDRDLVMARLAAPVYDVVPVAVSATAPTTGEALTVAGWGRTASTWVPNAPHTAALTVSALAATGADLAAKTTADTVCKGDAGAPALRTENGKPAIAAVTSRAWQGGCLGTDPAETRTGASEARVDDLASWIGALVNRSYQLVNPASGRCLNVSGAGPTWGNFTPIILFDCVPGAGNEAFQLTASGQLYNPASNRCLNVSGTGPTWDNKTPIILWDCVPGAGNEAFQLTASGQLYNPASNRCLNVSGTGPTWDNSTPIILFDCVPGAANETFALASADQRTAGASATLFNPASGRCVNVAGAGPTWGNFTPIILFDCVAGQGNEAFQLTASGQLYNPASNRCLNVSGTGPTWDNKTPIILWDCVPGAANEQFRATADGQLLNPASGRCLNVSGAGPWTNNNPIILFDCVPGAGNEKFVPAA